MPENKRLNYFNGQFLLEGDFQDEQSYHLNLQRDHARLFHTPGIAEGLDIQDPVIGATSVTVLAGVAYDGAGRRIVLSANKTVDLGSLAVGQSMFITVSYLESGTDPKPDPTGTPHPTRTLESAQINTLWGWSPPSDKTMQLVVARIVATNEGGVFWVDRSERLYAGTKVADLSVGTSQLIDGSVTETKLAGASVTGAKLAPLSVSTFQLVDGSVTGVKLADLAVTETKLADGSVTGAKLAPLSVGTSQLVDGSVTGVKLADLAVTTAKLADASVTGAKVLDDSIPLLKMKHYLRYDQTSTLNPGQEWGAPTVVAGDGGGVFLSQVYTVSPAGSEVTWREALIPISSGFYYHVFYFKNPSTTTVISFSFRIYEIFLS